MPFKVNKLKDEKSKRFEKTKSFNESTKYINTRNKISKSEFITCESLLNPNLQNSFLKRGNYSVYLPNGSNGQIKIIQLMDDSEDGIVKVNFSNAINGSNYSYKMYCLGDTLLLIGSPLGWYIK